jgi:hypothetical protein
MAHIVCIKKWIAKRLQIKRNEMPKEMREKHSFIKLKQKFSQGSGGGNWQLPPVPRPLHTRKQTLVVTSYTSV